MIRGKGMNNKKKGMIKQREDSQTIESITLIVSQNNLHNVIITNFSDKLAGFCRLTMQHSVLIRETPNLAGDSDVVTPCNRSSFTFGQICLLHRGLLCSGRLCRLG